MIDTLQTPDDLRIDGYLPIGSYAAIGDGRTLALVGIDGSIDWMCLPELDSPSVFGTILYPGAGGRFVVAPTIPFRARRRYVAQTNVLETEFDTDRGTVRVTDLLSLDPAGAAPWRELVRHVEGLSGTVPLHWRFEPRCGYGHRIPALQLEDRAILARDGDLQIGLRTWDAGEPEVGDGAAGARFDLDGGSSALLAMTASDGPSLPIPARDAVLRRVRETVGVWRSWVTRHTYDGPWRNEVERSLLAIRLLADARTGAIAAAGTTSLPEAIGATRNYDYRYGWVRDLCFTLDALMAVGMQDVTQSAVTWLLGATAHTHPRIDPVYKLSGPVLRHQESLPLPGYRSTQPVHLGNKAGAQLQLGGFGDFMETVCSYVGRGHVLAPGSAQRLGDIGDLLCRIWRNEDSGLWELPQQAHYGTSKLGSWVALERLCRLADAGRAPSGHLPAWRGERDAVRDFIETRLFSQAKNSYLLKAGSEDLDCGMLLGARRGFGDVTGPRINGTIDAIRRELHAGGPLFYRYSGMQEEENAFLACSFWMVEALALAGRRDEAAEVMDGACALGSDVGLYSEEMDPGSGAMLGNVPQALTHLSLINPAAALAR